nr:immunoglobulin light chain junction region [Macaca mulatta]
DYYCEVCDSSTNILF